METINNSDNLLSQKEYEQMQEEYMAYWRAMRGEQITDYQVFIESVRKYTEIIAGSTASDDSIRYDVTYDILGPEFQLDGFRLNNSLYGGFDESVIHQVLQSMPNQGLKGNSRWLYRYDYEAAEVKLGCLVHEGVSASQILDLGYLMELLSSYGISSYIDYEEQVFHLNAINPQLDEKKLERSDKHNQG